jgi:hypothetical protein
VNAAVIFGASLIGLAALVLGAGFSSGNMFLPQRSSAFEIDASRRSAPGCFWAVATFWLVVAIYGIVVVIAELS